jgi:hypothetical protein
MKSKKQIFGILFVLAVLTLTVNTVAADDLTEYKRGTVSGGVVVNGTEINPFANATDGSHLAFQQDLPSDVSSIDYAGLYVNIYSGSGLDTYGANTTIAVRLPDGVQIIYANNILKHPAGLGNLTNDPTTYKFNSSSGDQYTMQDVTLQYSDYQLYVDLAPYLTTIKNLTGEISVDVNSTPLKGLNFDARVKMIALVVAYNTATGDTAGDKYDYYVNSGQCWVQNQTGYSNFTTNNVAISEATLQNIALSSGDGNYKFNGVDLDPSENYTSISTYYKYHNWNVTEQYSNSSTNVVEYENAGSGTYSSFKNVLSVLTAKRQ